MTPKQVAALVFLAVVAWTVLAYGVARLVNVLW